MNRRFSPPVIRQICVLSLFLLLFPSTSHAVAPPVIRYDPYGDPLPRGAVARLGSMRLRHMTARADTNYDGSLIASMDHRLRLWDRATGRLLREYDDEVMNVWCMALSPDGKTVLSGNDMLDRAFWVWNLATGKRTQLHAATKHEDLPREVCFSGDGRSFAVHGTALEENRDYFSRIRIFDYPSLKQKYEFVPQAKREIKTAVLSHDGTHLVYPLAKSLRVHDLKNNKLLHEVELGFHASALAVSRDEKMIAVHHADHPVVIIHLGDPVRLVMTRIEGDTPSRLQFPTDGKNLYFASYSGAIHAIDPMTGKVLRLLREPVAYRYSWAYHANCHAFTQTMNRFSGDGRWMVRQKENLISCLDLKTGKIAPSFDDHRDGILVEAIPSPNDRLVATVSPGEIRLWELRTGKQFRRITGKDFVPGLKWSADGKQLIVAQGGQLQKGEKSKTYTGETGKLTWIDVVTGKVTRSVELPRAILTHASLLPDGNLCLQMIDEKQTLFQVILKLGTTREPWLFKREIDQRSVYVPNYGPYFSSDKSQLVILKSNDSGHQISLTDRISGKMRWEHRYSQNPEGGLFSDDGRRFAMLSETRLDVWDASTGRKVGGGVTKSKWRRSVSPLRISPDGRFIAVGKMLEMNRQTPSSFQNRGVAATFVNLLETATGQVRYTLPLLATVSGCRFTSDGRYLITSSEDGTAMTWDVYALSVSALSDTTLQDLGSADGATGFRAVCSLIHSGEKALELVRPYLKPVRVDVKEARRLIDDLDSETFQLREKASRELALLGDDIEDDLFKAMNNKPSLEAKRRLEELLQRFEQPGGKAIARLRALEVLEQIGTPQAVRLLQSAAAGYPGSRFTREAQDAVTRCNRRRSAQHFP